VTDLNRLGKRGSYRLGRLRAQGAGSPGPPPPLRPRFRRARHRGPTSLWLLAAAAGVAVIAGGAAAGLWFVPFAAGVGAGLASRIGDWRVRVLVPAVAAMAIAGWGIPLGWPALHGERAGGTAPVIAALAARPASAAAGVLLTLLVAVLQALAGLWLGRALPLRPRPAVPGAEFTGAEFTGAGAADAGIADVRALDAGAADVRALDAGAADAGVADVRALGAGAAGDPAGELDGGSGRQPGPAGPTMGE
jgi:hypothetical protein